VRAIRFIARPNHTEVQTNEEQNFVIPLGEERVSATEREASGGGHDRTTVE
jgi:hypothetical protein